MKIIDIPQGSALWHQHRREHFNASDAPAMMGCSPYKMRSQLLQELATGIVPEPTPETQRLFDDGHRTERLLRPVAESQIGDDLYAIVMVNGRESASLDGATLDGETLAEFKRLNDRLRKAMQPGCTGADLPLDYRVQMEQQLHCSGGKRVLFMAGVFDASDELIEERHCWYTPDLALRAQILRGWEQFAEDLANYKPVEAAPVVMATPQEHLPAVSVQLTGSLAVVSNLQPFGVALRAFVDKIPKKPSTDQEFADTEAACKRLKEAEDRLQQAEDAALAGMSDVELMRRTVAELRELARTTRLASEKMVKQRKEQIREEEVRRGHLAMAEHIAALNKRLGAAYIDGLKAGDFGAAIKGLKTLDSVRNAIDTELARAKIEASAMADKIDANIKALKASSESMTGLFPDHRALVLKAADDLAAVIAQRVAERKAADERKLDAERERIRAEEAERAEKAAREAAEQARIKAAAPPITPNDQRGPLPAAAGALAQTEAKAATAPASGCEGKGAHADERAPEPVSAAATPADNLPPFNLGEWNRRMGFTLTRAFIEETLRIPHSHTEKASVLWSGSDFQRICDALVAYILARAQA